MAEEILGSSSEGLSESGSEAISSSFGESSTSSSTSRRRNDPPNGPNQAASLSAADFRDIPPR